MEQLELGNRSEPQESPRHRCIYTRTVLCLAYNKDPPRGTESPALATSPEPTRGPPGVIKAACAAQMADERRRTDMTPTPLKDEIKTARGDTWGRLTAEFCRHKSPGPRGNSLHADLGCLLLRFQVSQQSPKTAAVFGNQVSGRFLSSV